MPLFSHLLTINTCWILVSYSSSHTYITLRLYQIKMCKYTKTRYEECKCLAGTHSEQCRHYPHCRNTFYNLEWCLGDCPTHTLRKQQAHIDRLAEEQHREFEAAAQRERAGERTFWRQTRESNVQANSERPTNTTDSSGPNRNPTTGTRWPNGQTNADNLWSRHRASHDWSRGTK